MREQARREGVVETEQEAAPQVEEESPRVKFVGGEIPPVQVAAAEETEDKNVTELKKKVGALVDHKFRGDYGVAFDSYDSDHDGKMTKDEIVQMLEDAGVGNGLTRGAWANGILDKLDMNHDRGVQWGEFESVFLAKQRA
jgi:hypothetical protein